MKANDREPLLRLFMAMTLGLFAMRAVAMRKVGFGDSEALYAAYALHPQPAYLDHPGLIGTIASLIGQGGAPTPERAHAVTIVVATMVPIMAFAIARASGASLRAACVVGLALAATPEIGIGLFALTPDLVLAPAWLASLGCAFAASRKPASDVSASMLWIAAGLLAGTCAAAKVSGLLLMLALVVALLRSPQLRAHARTPWPWAGLLVGVIVLVPIIRYEAANGFPMLRHRLVDTQAGAGLSLRTVGAFFGGQLAYVSPLLLAVVVYGAIHAWRRQGESAIAAISFFAFAVPFVGLAPLMLWSPVAEPHWLAPAFLALVFPLAIDPPAMPRWLLPASIALGFVAVVAVHVWVLVPESFRFARPADPRHDIANELFGWDDAERTVRELLGAQSPTSDVVIVGPHWTVCAQIHARLGAQFPVGCASPIRDDFDGWLPRARWQNADKVLWVTDNRFPNEPSELLKARTPARRARSSVYRGGRQARQFVFTLYEDAAHAAR